MHIDIVLTVRDMAIALKHHAISNRFNWLNKCMTVVCYRTIELF